MPIILGPDGPSLGGFVCPATVVEGELWKVGQLRPGDSVRFVALDAAAAAECKRAQEHAIATLSALPPPAATKHAAPAVIAEVMGHPRVTYRQAGDRYLLVEYGEMVLDLNLRFRVHALMQRLRSAQVPGVIELTPGIRSLQVHYDSLRLA